MTVETSCNACGPIKETVDDDLSFVQKIRRAKFHFPELDRFCHTGDVIDDAAVNGRRAIEAGAEQLPAQGREFAAEHAEMFRAKSQVVKTKVQDGWTSSLAFLAMIPSAVSEKWNEAAKIYHENKKNEDQSSSELALR